MDANRFQKKQKRKYTSLLNGNEDTTASKPNLIDRYNGMETKGDFKNSAIKTLFEVLGGGVIAPVLSASLGKFSPLAGVILAFGGNYMGDKTGLIRGLAMGTIAHGVAKSKEYREENTTFKDRISGLKDDWLYTLMLKNTNSSSINGINSDKSKEFEIPVNKKVLDNTISTIQKLSEAQEDEKEKFNIKESEKQSEQDPWEDDIDFSRF
ncbi:MAG: hypothetical protein HYR91_13135 [Flavobacteriia bacterium]|nr:hypothetical protein [Flavobacteriia bacterium]